MAHPLILASTSPYRADLLAPPRPRLQGRGARRRRGTARAANRQRARALRLAHAKAQAVAARYPESWVIGSDQVADLEGRMLGKPGDAERCRAQLAARAAAASSCFTRQSVLLRQGRAHRIRARGPHRRCASAR